MDQNVSSPFSSGKYLDKANTLIILVLTFLTVIIAYKSCAIAKNAADDTRLLIATNKLVLRQDEVITQLKNQQETQQKELTAIQAQTPVIIDQDIKTGKIVLKISAQLSLSQQQQKDKENDLRVHWKVDLDDLKNRLSILNLLFEKENMGDMRPFAHKEFINDISEFLTKKFDLIIEDKKLFKEWSLIEKEVAVVNSNYNIPLTDSTEFYKHLKIYDIDPGSRNLTFNQYKQKKYYELRAVELDNKYKLFLNTRNHFFTFLQDKLNPFITVKTSEFSN